MNKNQRRRFHHIPGSDPYKHTRTRDVQPQTENDVRSLRRLVTGSAVLTLALVSANMIKEGHSVDGVDRPATHLEAPSTTIVRAEFGDNLWDLQAAEGDSGRDLGHVVEDVVALNGGADIQAGQKVILLDDPTTSPRP